MNIVKDVRIIDTVKGTNHIVVMVINTPTVIYNTPISVAYTLCFDNVAIRLQFVVIRNRV